MLGKKDGEIEKKEQDLKIKTKENKMSENKIEPNFKKNTYGSNKASPYKISFYEGIVDHQALNCPSCGFECTHITKVEVFCRGEDAETHIHTTVDMEKNSTQVDKVKGHGRNPSARRDGLILSGHCESGCKFEIEISQHKGNTFFKGEKTGEKVWS